ncbi:MAG: SUMF1/EgtB/PvdO family nonheme iron enzyme [Planctomycetes bacterium]|nr:SUMF1/EgtB/PvdO family nonheme iron enzyme [Planctomycetota bacterium]
MDYCFICCRGFHEPGEETGGFPDFGADFRPIYHLGRGGMGRIYVVEDRAGRQVVLKTILEEQLVERFQREAAAIARLNHPSIVTLHLFRPDPPGPYLIMEFCRQGTLRHLLERRGKPCEEEWFLDAARALLEALDHAHGQGLVHRDISPENIFFQEDTPKLGDFGLATDTTRSGLTAPGHFVGKMHYAAPEQWENASKVDIRADLFSLGVTLYFALTGRSPFPVVDLSRVPRVAGPLLEALTKIEPGDRPASPEKALELLHEARSCSTRRVVAARVSLFSCVQCGFDGLEATPDAPFCPMCGHSQFWECPGCQKPVHIGLPFCKHCGLPVARVQGYRESLAQAIQLAEANGIYEALRTLFELRRVIRQEGDEANPARAKLQQETRDRVELWYRFLEEVWHERWTDGALAALIPKILKIAPASELLNRVRREIMEKKLAASYPTVPGFALLGVESFICQNDVEGKKHLGVAVYRCDSMAKAIGLGESARALDTEFVLLPRIGGESQFKMGSPFNEPERRSYHEQQHVVKFPHHFLIARTAVTRRVHAAILGQVGVSSSLPAVEIGWSEALAWCMKLGLQLPSEAEWEFACRGGTQTPFCFGSTLTTDQVNFDGTHPYNKGPRGPHRGIPVDAGSLPGNAYGLHEMHGNVWEWTRDLYSAAHGAPVGTGTEEGPEDLHVLRGGGYESHAVGCRSAHRHRLARSENWGKQIGFRPVKLLPECKVKEQAEV